MVSRGLSPAGKAKFGLADEEVANGTTSGRTRPFYFQHSAASFLLRFTRAFRKIYMCKEGVISLLSFLESKGVLSTHNLVRFYGTLVNVRPFTPNRKVTFPAPTSQKSQSVSSITCRYLITNFNDTGK